MSRVLLTAAIDDWDLGPLAAKEAAVMRLEPLGHVQVLRVDEQAPEQMRMDAEPPEAAGRCPSRPVSGQAQTSSAYDS